jgi:hypothetical protein
MIRGLTKVENMKLNYKAFLNLGVLFIFLAVVFSACAESPVSETPPAYTQMAGSPTPTRVLETTPTADQPSETASAPAVDLTREMQATSSAPITRQDVVVMFDSLENFTSVIDRLDGLNDDEKQELFDYFTQELELNDEIHQNCAASLTDEERAALDDGDMDDPLYQQANAKFTYAMTYTPACSQPAQKMDALMSQYGDMIMKVKELVSPYMTP